MTFHKYKNHDEVIDGFLIIAIIAFISVGLLRIGGYMQNNFKEIDGLKKNAEAKKRRIPSIAQSKVHGAIGKARNTSRPSSKACKKITGISVIDGKTIISCYGRDSIIKEPIMRMRGR